MSEEPKPISPLPAPDCSALATTDASLLNYLERRDRLQMIRSNNVTDFLVLAEDGTTCWGKTFRQAVMAAMAHDYPPNSERRDGQP